MILYSKAWSIFVYDLKGSSIVINVLPGSGFSVFCFCFLLCHLSLSCGYPRLFYPPFGSYFDESNLLNWENAQPTLTAMNCDQIKKMSWLMQYWLTYFLIVDLFYFEKSLIKSKSIPWNSDLIVVLPHIVIGVNCWPYKVIMLHHHF